VRGELARLYGGADRRLAAPAHRRRAAALPAFPAGRSVRSPVALGGACSWPATTATPPHPRGAMVSGRRAAEAVLAAR
jgi:hypothetical protein